MVAQAYNQSQYTEAEDQSLRQPGLQIKTVRNRQTDRLWKACWVTLGSGSPSDGSVTGLPGVGAVSGTGSPVLPWGIPSLQTCSLAMLLARLANVGVSN